MKSSSNKFLLVIGVSLLAITGLTCFFIKCNLRGTISPFEIKAKWQCDNHTVVVALTANYPQGRVVKYQLYADANRNGKFDQEDVRESYVEQVMIKSGELYMGNPIKVTDAWDDAKLFLRVSSDQDTQMVEISKCSNVRSQLTPDTN